jgi:hypothetical protein
MFFKCDIRVHLQKDHKKNARPYKFYSPQQMAKDFLLEAVVLEERYMVE